jgi:8-oxo-dGTP pyrophosphatase MutT (NUDIX family)
MKQQNSTPDRGRHGVVAVIQEDSRYLVIRRSQFVRAPNLLCLPGGGIELGESFEQAIHRELHEELELSVTVERHIWTSTTNWGTRLEWMLCSRHPESNPRPNPDEVAEVLWLQAEEMRHRSDLLGSLPEFLDAVGRGEIQLR